MQDNNLSRRMDLAVELISQLEDIYGGLVKASSDMEKHSGSFYKQLFDENKKDIRDQTDKFKENLEKIKQFNYEITEKINSWYDFVKSPEEIKRITFPLKLFFKKKNMRNSIEKINKAIANLTIENRFIKEQLVQWEHELELKAVQLIKQGDGYEKYQQQLIKKDEIQSELKYLLPTIPGICPVDLDLRDIGQLRKKLSPQADPG